MPTRNVNLSEQLDNFIEESVTSGNYQNGSEVVRAALRSLQEQHVARTHWLAHLRTSALEGFAELDSGKSRRGTPADLMADISAEVSKRAETKWPPSSSPKQQVPK